MARPAHLWPGGRPMWCPACGVRVVAPLQDVCSRCEAAIAEDIDQILTPDQEETP